LRLRIAVYRLTSCSGCVLKLIDLLNRCPEFLDKLEFVHFKELGIVREEIERVDVAIVEGAVTTPRDERLLAQVREESRVLIAVGTCAILGGVTALRNWMSLDEAKRIVYPEPENIESLDRVRPVSEVVPVDFEVPRCPVDEELLRYILMQIVLGKRPSYHRESLCMECKRRGIPCVVVTKRIPCLGPIVSAGCGALCPSFGRGCYGCYGLKVDPRVDTLIRRFVEMGIDRSEIESLVKRVVSWAEPVREAVKRLVGG